MNGGTTRRALLASAGATLALTACHGRGTVLKVGSQKGGTKALMLAAGALAGAPYTVEWSDFPAAQNLLEALGSNAVDLGLIGDAPFQFARASGSPVRAVAAMASQLDEPGQLAVVVPGASPVHTVADLIGKRVATTHGSIGHYLLLRALAVNGYPAHAVQVVLLSPSDSRAALQSGSVDAWSTWAPYTVVALAEGARSVVDGRRYLDAVSFDVASADALDQRKALLADFCQREARALAWAADHTERYGEVLAHETGLPLAIAWRTAAISRRRRVPIDQALIGSQQVIVDTFHAAGEIGKVRPVAEGFAPV